MFPSSMAFYLRKKKKSHKNQMKEVRNVKKVIVEDCEGNILMKVGHDEFAYM